MNDMHLTASAVVLDPDRGLVLLVHQKASDRLLFPGGHVDDNEDPADAAVREVVEETGVEATIVAEPTDLPGMEWTPSAWQVAKIPAPSKPDRGPGKPAEPAHMHYDLLYIATGDSTLPLVAQIEEVKEAVWVRLDDLDRLPVRGEVPGTARRAWAYLTAAERNR